MRFGFITEGDTPPGSTHYHRYHELVEEVLLAEKVGFDLFGSSEQHLAIGGATTSAPEVIYSYLIALTSRIRFAHAIVLLPTRFNHPLRVAERLATMDIFSHGRVEAACGRGNTMLALRGFEVSPEESKAQQEEGLDLIRAAFLNDPFTFVGEYYKVPPRTLIPKPVQKPHPPLLVAATSPGSHAIAAEKGIGVVSFANFSGFDLLVRNLRSYDETWEATMHALPTYRRKAALMSGMICAETPEQARREFEPLVEYVRLAVDAYDRLSTTSADYSYMKEIKEHVDEKRADVDYMINESASFIVGDPDACVRQVRVFEELGVEELWLRIDSQPHEQLMRSIELFGKYVIPHFKNPEAIVRSPEDVIADIRSMRGEHEAELRRFMEAKEQEQLATVGVGDGDPATGSGS
jgi:alkanesulfonate monooxygenase SsuD/methylene tetrahydromethanopterin reductase-like flavin-dependent oxidoreductase (luciferase family)